LVGGPRQRPKKDEDKAIPGLISMARSIKHKRFVLCRRNDGCEDLEKRKIYQVLSDDEGTKEGYIRVIDESGEDYLYPESYFVFIDLPREAEAVLMSAG
jgi:hypothetical protein